MRITLASEHYDYFNKHSHITFEGLFPTETIALLEKEISKNGRDLWRSNAVVKETVFHRGCSEIASELTRNKIIRIAFDQSLVIDDLFSYGDKRGSLNDLSCVQPILCALMLRLSEGDPPPMTTLFCPCPEKQGTALFFSGNALLSWAPFKALKGEKFLLIAYTSAKPLYVARKEDPAMNSLKQLGYGFGDHLNTTTHPILFSQNARSR